MRLTTKHANDLMERNDEVEVADAASEDLYADTGIALIYDADGEFNIEDLAGYEPEDATEELDGYIDMALWDYDEPSRDELAKAAHDNDEFTNYYWNNQGD